MAIVTQTFTLETHGEGDTHDVTEEVRGRVRASGLRAGIATVFVPGSTAGLTTIEFEPGAVRDLGEAFERIAPRQATYHHNERWGDMNGYAHVRSAMLGPSITVPFAEAELLTGTWQQIILVDFDNRPRQRRVVCQIIGE
jgi:secondary thiamine-phosphate synthase enzyme